MPQHIGESVSVLLQILFFLIAVYYLAIGIFSFFPAPYKKGNGDLAHFAIVIPAHNEAGVLPSLIRSLQQQTYPSSHYRIFVLPDGCIDQTEAVAASMGAQILPRVGQPNTGKGSALADAFTQLMRMDSFDAFIVLDADNTADPSFLFEINEALQSGALAVQGYIDTKNPNQSWLSHAYALWYWVTNRTIQMGYHRLGLGCSLGGTGFALSRKLLCDLPWNPHTLCEDAEYTIQMALHQKKAVYAPHARVYDEKPISLSTSVRQRIRWAQGITQVQRDYGFALLRRGKWNTFLRFWSNLFVPLCFMIFLTIDIGVIHSLLRGTVLKFVMFWMRPLPFLFLNAYLFSSVISVFSALRQDRKWNKTILLNVFGVLVYFISWIPAGIFGILRHHKKTWYHTGHLSEE